MIAFRGAAVSAWLAGLLAETRLDQHYLNDTETLESPTPSRYRSMPCCWASGVALGERRLAGQVVAAATRRPAMSKPWRPATVPFASRCWPMVSTVQRSAMCCPESVTIHLSYAEPLTLAGRLPALSAADHPGRPVTASPKVSSPGSVRRPAPAVEYAFEAQVFVRCAGRRRVSSQATASAARRVRRNLHHRQGGNHGPDFILEIQPVAEQSLGVCAPLAEDRAIAAVSRPPPARITAADATSSSCSTARARWRATACVLPRRA